MKIKKGGEKVAETKCFDYLCTEFISTRTAADANKMTLQLFKWMMALAVMLYLPLLFERVKGFRRQDTKHTDEYIKNRVESIYFDVTHFYNQMKAPDPSPASAGEAPTWEMPGENGLSGGVMGEEWRDFDRLYCSDAWNAQLTAVQQCEENGSDDNSEQTSSTTEGAGGRQFFTCNYWLGRPDIEFLYINKVEVIDRTGDRATVCLTLHNGDLAIPVLLVMLFEHDEWHIDNMTYYWNEKPSTRYYDWRQEMEQYTIDDKQ